MQGRTYSDRYFAMRQSRCARRVVIAQLRVPIPVFQSNAIIAI